MGVLKSSRRLIPAERARHDLAGGPVAALPYYEKVLGTAGGPIAYWPLWEAAGLAAACLVNPLQNGVYTGVTLGQPGIGDGNTSPFFDGANDFVNCNSATLFAAVDGHEGSMMLWIKVPGGTWTDGGDRYANYLYTNAANHNYFRQPVAANQLMWRRLGGGAAEDRFRNGVATTAWFHMALTWSEAADEVKAYYNGIQEGVTMTTLGAFVQPITRMVIGAYFFFGGSGQFHGWLAHQVIWDTVLTQPQIASLATV